jgi:hypothetical protein
MGDHLISAYLKTEFHVNGFDKPILVGENSINADKLLVEKKLTEWAYVTAYNPLSYALSENENEQRNSLLKRILKDYLHIEGEGQDKNQKWPPEKSFFILGITLYDAKILAIKFGQRAIVYGKIFQRAQLIETLAFYGNPKIITYYKTAFLYSCKVPTTEVLKCYDWATEQREKGNCVIIGFHSQIEKNVLRYLLKGMQPIILALARGLKEKLEPEFEKPLEQGRLLIITPFDKSVKRVSSQNLQTRNQLITSLTDQITIGYTSPW